jgi:hypothetical protein
MNRPLVLSRSAFATIMVMVLLGLVTTALAALVSVTRNDYRQTADAVARARLRQLVLAAVADADHRASQWGPLPQPRQWTTEVPAGDGSVRAESVAVSKAELRVRIIARLGESSLIQTLDYGLAGAKWQLVAVHTG